MVYERVLGFMDEHRRRPIVPDVMMRIASISKPVTAAAIHKLAADGMLNLSDHVFELGQTGGGLLDIAPYPRLGDARMAHITVLHLLRHQGGWDRHAFEPEFDPPFREIEIAEAMSIDSPPSPMNTVRYMLGQPLQFAPGSRRAYSNLGYMILGLIIEEVSGRGYMTYVHENVFSPLGVSTDDVVRGRTFPEDRSMREPWYDAPGLARNVFDPTGPLVRWPDGGWDLEAKLAHGGLVSTPRAILEFLDAYQVNGDQIGRPRRGSEGAQWWWYHTGSLDGTNTLAVQRGDGINYVVFFNRRLSSQPDYAEQFLEQMQACLAA